MRMLLAVSSLLVFAGCPLLEEDGPGFYGKVTLAGGNSTASVPAAQNHPMLRQLSRLLLPAAGQDVPRIHLRRSLGLPKTPPRVVPIIRRAETWRAGEVIVVTRLPQRDHADLLQRNLRAALEGSGWSVGLQQCNTSTYCLWRVAGEDGKPLGLADTRVAAQHLTRARDVRFAETNNLQFPTAVPDDEYRSIQWHYDAMNLPSAWDVTTGDSSVVAAVIDTGLYLANPDFGGRLGQGADLNSDANIGNDGNGRDDDPNDPGDDIAGGGSFHGTHCAGTVGAATNNAVGVAGVSWSGTILPVRVLGVGGGTLFDIIGGMQWALGDNVDGVTRNTRVADVLSMSLGGEGQSQSYEDVIADAVARSKLVIVAAGNDNIDASRFMPANVAAAITVGATRLGGTRASYSNFGQSIDVMAPGGELAEDRDDDGNADGVLSTVKDRVDFLQGTSMATPHVAGLAVLMKTLRPELTQEEAVQVLRETGRSDQTCDDCGGARMIDAAAVVAQLGAAQNQPFLSVSPNEVNLGKDENTFTINVRNSGVGTLNWTARIESEQTGWVISPQDGTLAERSNGVINLNLTRTGTEGDATLVVSATGLGQERRVRLHYDESVARQRPDIKTVFVAAGLVKDGEVTLAKNTNDQDAVVATEVTEGFNYKLMPLAAGEYMIFGLTDDNGNGEWEDGEGIGLYPDLASPKTVVLAEDQKLIGVDFLVRPTFLGGGTPTCPPNSSPQGDSCVCDSGYEVNADLTACVPAGQFECPPHSSPMGDSCICDNGYVVSEDQTECVPE